MAPDSSFFAANLDSFSDWVKLMGVILGALVSVSTLIAALTRLLRWWRMQRNQRSLKKRLGADLYPFGVIEQAIRYYIVPNCQSLDPAGGEEPRHALATEQNLFAVIDKALKKSTEHRYIILLADSGMGKTTFLLNYYARHLRRRKKKFDLVVMPLGVPNPDKRVAEIKDQQNKVLFLDALDEDTLAIVDHGERLQQLMQLTQEFRKVLITCRTQFFPKDEEIPVETGIVKVGSIKAGEAAQYLFHKLYISPFTDDQVHAYLKCRYPFWQLKLRRRAWAIIQKIPRLTMRPMLLAHIEDLTERQFSYAFELYEEMVDAWLVREQDKLKEKIEKEPLREFCERLAIDLFSSREQRGAERIPGDQLSQLAQTYQIPLQDWQLKGRSLLNRDAVGNYKFAHRSIMEYLFVKRFLELKSAERPKTTWTEQMYQFLMERIDHSYENGQGLPDLSAVDIKALILSQKRPIYQFRSHSMTLDGNEVTKMIKQHHFFDSSKNSNDKGILHIYDDQAINGVVVDHATGLMWQQNGSDKAMNYDGAKKWLAELNKKGFAGFKDWRLPTLEEAMSLMEPEEIKDGRYINPIFDKTQRWIWTSDPYKGASRAAWVVVFNNGRCSGNYWGNVHFVRAVRPGQSSF